MIESSRAVFLSYASDDAEAAGRICEALRAASIEVWFDRSELRGGEAWDRQIHERIRDCRLFVAIISAHTEARDEGYFRREWKLAVDRTNDMAEHKAFLVPVAIDDTPERDASVPDKFRHVQWTRLRGGETTPAFVARIITLISAEHPSPAPAVESGMPPPVVQSRPASRRLGSSVGIAASLIVVAGGWLVWHFAGTHAPVAPTHDASAIADKSIAVLPFVNMSGDAQDDYLGQGLSEELSNRLTKIAQLRVAARTSAFAFKGKDMDVSEIAARLGVRYVVQGSVKRQGDRLRVTAALVDGATGSNRWSNAYEPSVADFFAVEDDIAGQVMQALELILAERPKPPQARAGNGNPIAYDFYLQGLAYLRQPKSTKTLEAADQLFERALSEQPAFSRAQAGLCETRVERYVLEKVPAYVASAEQACTNAEALDSDAAEVHMAVGRLRLVMGNAAAAEASFRRALALVPLSPDALIGLGESLEAGGKAAEAERSYQRAIIAQSQYAAAHLAYGNFLFSRGRAAEAISVYERATLLTPDNPNAFSNLGGAYLQMGDFDKAAAAFDRSLELEPRRASYSNAGTVRYYLGQYAEAAELYRKAIELAPADHRLWGNLADALRFGMHPEEATQSYRRALELAQGELAVNPKHAVNQAQAAYYAARLGEKDRARRFIAVALAEGEGDYQAQYYVTLAELGLGDRSTALTHARMARKLGYPEKLMQAAPELGEIRKML
jgi:TolB-like protein/Tfp pilus assembly protein PilF